MKFLFRQLFNHMIAPLLIRIKVSFQVVWKKEQFQNQEHDGKLNKYDYP